MQRQPNILKISRGDPKATIRAFVIMLAWELWAILFAGWQVFWHGFLANGWEQGLLLVACVVMTWHVVRQIRTFATTFDADTPDLKMDSSGLSWSLPIKRQIPWSGIEACASRNKQYRTTLRVFRKGCFRGPVDIDFALAAQPKQSLDQALVACAAWIVATRDPSITESPIREIADKPERSSWASRPPEPALRGFIVAFVVFSLVAVGLISAASTVREERRCLSNGASGSAHFYDWCEALQIRPSR